MISLSGMLYQLEVNKTMQTALMEEVRSGAMHPRMFEVFGGLSKTIGELNKQLLQTVEAIKVTYRDLKDDIRERNQKGLLTLGTKELIKKTKMDKIENQRNKDQDIEDVESEEVK
jgi:hypothetical protein